MSPIRRTQTFLVYLVEYSSFVDCVVENSRIHVVARLRLSYKHVPIQFLYLGTFTRVGAGKTKTIKAKNYKLHRNTALTVLEKIP